MQEQWLGYLCKVWRIKAQREGSWVCKGIPILDLECSKLNDFEKIYLFMKNLQPWATDKLRRQTVETLA